MCNLAHKSEKRPEESSMRQVAIVHVHRPELSAPEREKRMEAIKKAVADLILATTRLHKEGAPQ